jgi:hypothetical protein
MSRRQEQQKRGTAEKTMSAKTWVIILSIALTGCAEGHAPGDTFIDIVGTPFLIGFKIPFCLASIAVAGPIAGLAALNPGEDGRETERALGAGLAENCGPPYAVSY